MILTGLNHEQIRSIISEHVNVTAGRHSLVAANEALAEIALWLLARNVELDGSKAQVINRCTELLIKNRRLRGVKV